MTVLQADAMSTDTPFLGLAPFLRASIAGDDLRAMGQEMLTLAGERGDDANLWMNLSLAMQCVGQRDLGLAIQAQALATRRIFHLPAAIQPAKLRVLMLMVPGDLAANTPLECLLEDSDIDLIYYYVTVGDPLSLPVPEHDVLLVAMGDSDENRPVLAALENDLANWPQPVVNAPHFIPATDRSVASVLLKDAPGVLIPPTLYVSRTVLGEIARSEVRLADLVEGCDFPIILRPVGSQAGRDLEKFERPDDVVPYLERVADPEFFLSRFVDYSGKDGQFRKYRVAMIDGVPFACHMGVSSNWMVHYVNAGMYEDAAKREEEARFMENFDEFAARHREAFTAIRERNGLDYLCIDCAETTDGQLLIFEADHCMVVHAMDPEDLFPYKQVHMLKVKNAFRDYLFRLKAAQS
jgi:glutathione synthase/RimK-type ligase-like ATP-grasp enzyme